MEILNAPSLGIDCGPPPPGLQSEDMRMANIPVTGPAAD